MSRTLGTVARGVRTPIFREGDNVVEGVVSSVLTALKENGIQPHDKDVAAVTESVVARCQGNYATVEQIAADVKAKTGGKTVGVTFPILSRNRFSLLLQRHCRRCGEGGADAQLSLRRGGQPSGVSGSAGRGGHRPVARRAGSWSSSGPPSAR